MMRLTQREAEAVRARLAGQNFTIPLTEAERSNVEAFLSSVLGRISHWLIRQLLRLITKKAS